MRFGFSDTITKTEHNTSPTSMYSFSSFCMVLKANARETLKDIS